MYRKKCKICGKDIEVVNPRYSTCASPECKRENQRRAGRICREKRINDPVLKEIDRIKSREYQRRKKKPVFCRICGKEMIRNYESGQSFRETMHTDCILKDCIEEYTQFRRLSTLNVQRLHCRGYDMQMLREIINTGEIY